MYFVLFLIVSLFVLFDQLLYILFLLVLGAPVCFFARLLFLFCFAFVSLLACMFCLFPVCLHVVYLLVLFKQFVQEPRFVCLFVYLLVCLFVAYLFACLLAPCFLAVCLLVCLFVGLFPLSNEVRLRHFPTANGAGELGPRGVPLPLACFLRSWFVGLFVCFLVSCLLAFLFLLLACVF